MRMRMKMKMKLRMRIKQLHKNFMGVNQFSILNFTQKFYER